MIVLIAGDNVEDHPTRLLFAGTHREPQALDYIEGLLVGVSAGRVEIEVSERSQGLHMQLAAVTQTIEPSRHEMAPAVLFQQTTLRHLDTGISGHERIGILDDCISFRVLELF